MGSYVLGLPEFVIFTFPFVFKLNKMKCIN